MPENRIDPLTVANAATDKALAPVSPTGQAALPAGLWTIIATIVVGIAGTVAALPTFGVAMPPVVIAIATMLTGLGAALGISSVGARKS